MKKAEQEERDWMSDHPSKNKKKHAVFQTKETLVDTKHTYTLNLLQARLHVSISQLKRKNIIPTSSSMLQNQHPTVFFKKTHAHIHFTFYKLSCMCQYRNSNGKAFPQAPACFNNPMFEIKTQGFHMFQISRKVPQAATFSFGHIL